MTYKSPQEGVLSQDVEIGVAQVILEHVFSPDERGLTKPRTCPAVSAR